MTRICSKHGPRYPVYNDKQGRIRRSTHWYHWYSNYSWEGANFFPAPIQTFPPLPRPTIRIKHLIKQPKATMGFVRGNRMTLKESKS